MRSSKAARRSTTPLPASCSDPSRRRIDGGTIEAIAGAKGTSLGLRFPQAAPHRGLRLLARRHDNILCSTLVGATRSPQERPALRFIFNRSPLLVTKRPLDILLAGEISRKLKPLEAVDFVVVIRYPRALVSSRHSPVEATNAESRKTGAHLQRVCEDRYRPA